MFVEFMVVIVLGKDSFFGNHDSQQNTFVSFQELPLLYILENEVVYDLKLNWNVRSFKNLQN